jgi:microcystin-dependent protein
MPTTPRLKLRIPAGTDPADVPADNGLLANGIDQAAMYDQGAVAGRPAAALAGKFWLDPNTGLLYLDTGTAWLTLNSVPVEAPGTLKLSARATADAGWLLCDGSAVSRTTYAALFAAISTSYGTGNGTSTFNLPDFRDRAVMGAGPTNALGTAPGAPTHNHVLPAHSHTLPDHAHGMADHSHYTPDHLHGVSFATGGPNQTLTWSNGTGAARAGASDSHAHGWSGSTGAADRSLQTSGRAEGAQNTYGAGAIGTTALGDTAVTQGSSLQPSLACNVMVKT